MARFKVLNQIRKYSRDRLVFDESFMTELADLPVHDLNRLTARGSSD
ncbi:hypothetical protein RMSM_03504 [Rhodopirellula maiorica SM1]|uniref:Uncharacterized protein n=1 Tax=Rhodopirellula maiorica SM1 TaxID=1265738 RepID=M5RJT0_9BACT|nr:hypothetical protein [Rhodopirellula maiorica]EMI19578.1 hypothetical protein RMSM_03504 [Rhodopirellula maiorica SM1]